MLMLLASSHVSSLIHTTCARKDKKQVMMSKKSLTPISKSGRKRGEEERSISVPKTPLKAMKSPFTTPENRQFFNPKPPACNNTTNNNPNNTTQFCYEPTSVLDVRRSPSPVAGGSDSVTGFTAVSGVSDDSPLHWEEHVLHHPPLFPSDDWDLPQFAPFESQNPNPSHFPSSDLFDPSLFAVSDFNNLNQSSNFFNPQNDFNNPLQNGCDSNLEFDLSQLDQLIRAAASIESNELQLTQVILARLNQRLQLPVGKPLQRAAFYFKEALQFLLTGSNWAAHHFSSSEIVQKIRAYKAFSEISPVTLFANFTANQPLLEALDRAMFIHVIDFEIGLGGQWASFMQEIAIKSRSRNVPPSALRITAVIPEESSIEAKLIKDNLQQFARELGIQFQLEFVFFGSFEVLLFNSIRFINGELIAVNLSPAIFRHLGASESISGFLRVLRRISPQITVFVDTEGWRDTGTCSFRRNFLNGLEFYSAILESLDASNTRDLDLIRRIEKFLIRPKIFASVASAGNRMLPWRELFSSAGLSPVGLSEITDSQAELIVRRTQVRGFHVAKRHGVIMLCWHDRELVATSAWRC